MENQNECQCPDCESGDMKVVAQCEYCQLRTCRECTYECYFCGKTICCDCLREHGDELCCVKCDELQTQREKDARKDTLK